MEHSHADTSDLSVEEQRALKAYQVSKVFVKIVKVPQHVRFPKLVAQLLLERLEASPIECVEKAVEYAPAEAFA